MSNSGTMQAVNGLTLDLTSGTYTNQSGGHIVADAASTVALGATSSAALTNHGFIDVGGHFTLGGNGGHPTLTNGSDGVIDGTGTLDVTNGTFVENGILAPGSPTGMLTINGDVTLQSPSQVRINLGGTASSQYSRLNVGGTFALDGMLHVDTVNSFTPAAGQSFDIMNWGQLGGTFASGVQLPVLSSSLTWDTSHLYTNGVLSIAASAPPAQRHKVTINFDTLPNGEPITANTAISTQYQSLGAIFSSSGGSPLIQSDGQASSAPNFLIGNPDAFEPITIDFTSGVSNVGLDLISVGDATVTVYAYTSDLTTVIDQISVTNPGTGVNVGGHNPITLQGDGIYRVVAQITQPWPTTGPQQDGFGIDDLSFYTPTPEPASLALLGGFLPMLLRRRRCG